MQGFRLLVIGADGKPTNHGTVLNRITDEKWLCYFSRIPNLGRICDVVEMETWLFFPDDDAMNTYILSLTPPPEPVNRNVSLSGSPPEPVKKKKKARRKASV